MKKLFLGFILLIAAAGRIQAQTPTTPLEMNDYLVAITEELYERGGEWGTKFNEARESKDYASLTETRRSLEDFINASIKDVQNLKDIKHSKDLRMAMLDFLRFEKTMIRDAFMPFEKLDKNVSDETLSTMYEQLTSLSGKENEQLAKVNAEQQKYAKANGFTIEEEAAE